MPHRLDPPGVDARNEAAMVAQMKIQRFLLDQLAARQVDEYRIVLHQLELPPTDYSKCFASQRCRQENHIGGSQHRIQTVRLADPVDWNRRLTSPIDSVN